MQHVKMAKIPSHMQLHLTVSMAVQVMPKNLIQNPTAGGVVMWQDEQESQYAVQMPTVMSLMRNWMRQRHLNHRLLHVVLQLQLSLNDDENRHLMLSLMLAVLLLVDCMCTTMDRLDPFFCRYLIIFSVLIMFFLYFFLFVLYFEIFMNFFFVPLNFVFFFCWKFKGLD